MEKTEQKKMFYTTKDGFSMGLVGVLIPIVMSLLIAILMVFIAFGAGSGYEALFENPVFVYITQVLCELGFVVAVVVYNKITKTSFKTASYMQTKPKFLNWAVALVVGVALPIFFDPLISMWEMLLKSWGIKILGIGVPFETGLDLTLCIVVLGLVPAFCEEWLFRGAVLNGLREKGMWFAVLYSTMCFALMHGGLQQLPYTFILGFVIGVIVFYTKSIWMGMLVHACNNITVLVAGFLSKDAAISERLAAADVIYALLMACVGVLIIVGTVVFAKKYNQPKQQTIENPMKASQNNKQKDVLGVSMAAITVVVAIVIMIIRGF